MVKQFIWKKINPLHSIDVFQLKKKITTKKKRAKYLRLSSFVLGFLCKRKKEKQTGFVQKNLFKIHKPLQYGAKKQHKGMQLCRTSGKGAQPLL